VKYGGKLSGDRMKYSEWKAAWEADPDLIRTGDDPSLDYKDIDGISVIRDYIALAVLTISSSFTPDESVDLQVVKDIEIYDEGHHYLGLLIPCKNREVLDKEIHLLSDARYAAYINDVSQPNFTAVATHRFRYNYVVIDYSQYSSYVSNYKLTAPIWGGFIHADHASGFPQAYIAPPKEIKAVLNLNMPQTAHLEKAVRAIAQPYAFERYLNSYHLLELIFNFQLVENIRKGSTLDGITELNKYLSKNFSTEADHLEIVITSRCTRPKDFEHYFQKIITDQYYIDAAKRILVDGAKGKYLTDYRTYFQRIINGTAPSLNDAALVKLTVHSIYQVRCAIAHSKLGEYFLTSLDERFVVEIIEPLLQEVLLQAFTV
jgi:hypothetical protein